MADVVVLHHALGRTPGVRGFAADLAAAGHTVTVPDLFDGRTFDTVQAGVEHVRSIGFPALVERAAAAVADLPPEQVYLGFSLGVVAAQRLAQTRPGARGAVLCHACLPSSEFGGWPPGVPVQVHAAEHDPWFTGDGDAEAARALVAEAPDAVLALYPGDGHLFAEPASPDHDPVAAALLLRRVLAFLAAPVRPGRAGARAAGRTDGPSTRAPG
ncbi:dienelactone hydrolase family protein [Pseudonocardia sp. NPDC049635]|uniref:dienelactone hydrolase family protein n=1 Tax=Pseudonocardia sp. NPDC049635 TaxID=3155506 RepID=UPI0033E4E350